MTNWNPNASPSNATIGLEWMPNAQGLFTLDAVNKMTAVSLDQSASVAIPTILIPNAGLPVRGGIYAVSLSYTSTA